MSRRQQTSKGGAAVGRRPRRSVPVILYVAWPVWGPIVRSVKAEKKRKAEGEKVTKADLTAMAKAVKTGNLDELEEVARQVKRRSFRFRNRHVVDAAGVAFGLAASKLLVMGPSLLPLLGMLIVGACFFGAPVWIGRTSRSPIPELKKRILDRIPNDRKKLRTATAWLCSPRAGAASVALFGLWWWGAPLGRVAGFWTWFVVTVVTLAVRAWRFEVRAFDVEQPTTGTPEGDYHEFVAGKVAAANGSLLQGTEDFFAPDGRRLGWTGGVVLPRGSAGASEIAPMIRKNVATTFRVGVEDVMAERFQKPEGGFDETRFVMTVLDEPGSNAIWTVHEYNGSDFDPATGIWTQAIRADWKPGVLQLYSPKIGSFSGHFSGETGGGKSEGMETALRSVTARGVVAPWIIDLGAATFGDWRDRVEVFVDKIEDVVPFLTNVEACRELRKRKRGKLRQIVNGEDVGPCRVYPVDRERPALLGVFDEWSFSLEDATHGKMIASLTEDIVTQQRKEIMPLWAAGQSTSLKYGFKNNNNIRTQFQAGFMIAFKNNAESGRQAFGKNISVDPSTLPMGEDYKGACFLTSNADARDAMARSRWVRYPKRFDAEIDIPPIPRDEIDVLTKGLSTRPALVQVPANMPSPRQAPAAQEPTPLRLVDEPAVPKLSPLAVEIRDWVIQQERPIQRQEVVTEFRNKRTQAGSRAIDGALAELKEASELVADAKGYYSSAKEGVA